MLVSEIGGDLGQVPAVLAMTMVACGFGTIVQALGYARIASGHLCPNLCRPNYFAAAMGTAWLGGLPLMRSMTVTAGLFEVIPGRVFHRLGFLFPTEITGLVVFMVAVGLVPLGASKFLGIVYAGDPIQPTVLAIAAVTLLAMVGLNVWGSGRIRLYAVLVGMIIGYVLSFMTGVLTAVDLQPVADAAWIGLPDYDGFWTLSFRWSLLPVFLIVSICGALKSVGNLMVYEKANDADWQQADIGCIGDGLLGGLPSDMSSSNVALSIASGATSRRIIFAAGGLNCPAGAVAAAQRPALHHAGVGWGSDPRAGGLISCLSFMRTCTTGYGRC